MSHPMHSPAGFPHQPPHAPKSGGSTVIKVLLIVFAVLAACCICCILIAYFGYQTGTQEMERRAAEVASGSQAVQNNFGTLEPADVEFSLFRGPAVEEELNRSCFVFQVRGPLGDGELVFEKVGSSELGRLIQIRIDGEVIPVDE